MAACVSSATTAIPPSLSSCEVKKPQSLFSKINAAISRVRQNWINTIDHVCPINPLTKRRPFISLPIKFEFFLGKISEFGEKNMSTTDEKYASVTTVFDRIIGILPSYKTIQWPASLRIIKKDQVNAYCTPGCRVTVYTGIIEKIREHMKTIQSAPHIEFKDEQGKTVQVDVRDVSEEDVIAALLGHELTHGAARHSGARILFGLFLELITRLASTILRGIATTFFVKSKEDVNLHNEKRGSSEADLTRYTFTPIGSIFNGLAALFDIEFIQSFVRFSLKQSYSRSNEYEADKLGMELAHKAGYNAKGGLVLAEILRKEGFEPENRILRAIINTISTHPLGIYRLRANYETLKELGVNLEPKAEDKRQPLMVASW